MALFPLLGLYVTQLASFYTLPCGPLTSPGEFLMLVSESPRAYFLSCH